MNDKLCRRKRKKKCSYPSKTFSVSSTLSKEIDNIFPLICSNIKCKNLTHYQVKYVLINFNQTMLDLLE